MKDKPKPTPLTDEQRRLVEQYQHLPKWAVKKWPNLAKRLGEDEAISTAALAICHAARRYDPARSCFKTWAAKYMLGFLLRAVRTGGAIRTPDYIGIRIDASSLSDPLGDGDGEFGDTIAAPEGPARLLGPDEADALRRAIGRLSARDQVILNLLLEGRTLREIGELFRLSRERVRQIVRASQRLLVGLLQLDESGLREACA